MNDEKELLRKLNGITELLEDLIIFKALMANVAGGKRARATRR